MHGLGDLNISVNKFQKIGLKPVKTGIRNEIRKILGFIPGHSGFYTGSGTGFNSGSFPGMIRAKMVESSTVLLNPV